jgi:hypothetical protein
MIGRPSGRVVEGPLNRPVLPGRFGRYGSRLVLGSQYSWTAELS